jgi:putative salt-induced outer membrane protein YdiY
MQTIMNEILTKRNRASGLRWLKILVLGAAVLVFPDRMLVHAGESAGPDDNPSVNPEWTPPADGFDWIQLTSDEWLKGEIVAMYNDKMEFDSKELDLLTFDFEDIRQIRTKRRHQLLGTDRKTVTGALFMQNDRIIVKGAREVAIDRGDVVSIAAGDPKEINYWTAKVTLGANFRRGNQSQLDYNTKWAIQRRTPKNRFAFDYLGTISRIDDIDTINNHSVTTFFDIFYSNRFFIRPVNFEYFRDPFKNIEHRYTFGAQLGYTIFDSPKTEWDVSIGPGYQFINYSTVQEGEDEIRKTFTGTVGTTFDRELTDGIDFNTELRFQIGDKDSGGLNTHWISTFEFELTKKLDFDVSFVWDRMQDPVADEDGVVPEQDDYRLIFGIGLDL